MERDAQALYAAGAWADVASSDRGYHRVKNRSSQEFGRGVLACKFRRLVEVAEVQIREHAAHGVARPSYVHDDAVGVEVGPPELEVHHVGGAVKPARRPENLALEAVRDHEVVTYRY